MDRQIIISISREFGSGGKEVAFRLAKRLGINCYDNNLLIEKAKTDGLDIQELVKYDEMPKNKLFYRKIGKYSNSPHENVAYIQFDMIKSLAERGESFVIIGRCSEYVLKGNPNLLSLFIYADMPEKIARVKARKHAHSDEEAIRLINKTDNARKNYHDYFCKKRWGESDAYHLSVDSGLFGIESTVDLVEKAVQLKFGNSESSETASL